MRTSTAMAAIYSAAYSSVAGVQGATPVQSPLLPPSALAAAASAELPALLVAEPQQLILLLPQLRTLAKSNIVIQVSTAAAEGDHAPVLALRGSGLSIVYSASDDEAKRNALVAARVAASGHGVVHFGEFDATKIDRGFDAKADVAFVKGQDVKASNGNGEKATTNGNGSAPTNGDATAAPSEIETLFRSAFAQQHASTSSFVGAESPKTLIVALGNVRALETSLPAETALVSLALYRPLSSSQIRSFAPPSVETIVVLEQVYKKSSKWAPLYLDVVSAFAEQDDDESTPKILSGTLGKITDAAAAVKSIQGECRQHRYLLQKGNF